jgi:hypothetical protein
MLIALSFFSKNIYRQNKKFFNDKKALAQKKEELVLQGEKNEEKIADNLAI